MTPERVLSAALAAVLAVAFAGLLAGLVIYAAGLALLAVLGLMGVS